jgi:hypothetical protein
VACKTESVLMPRVVEVPMVRRYRVELAAVTPTEGDETAGACSMHAGNEGIVQNVGSTVSSIEKD